MSTEKDIITFYNERGASEKNFDIQNNDFRWSHLPFSFMADKMQDKGFQPACLFQWLDLLTDMTDEVEVLQHGSNHHENHVSQP